MPQEDGKRIEVNDELLGGFHLKVQADVADVIRQPAESEQYGDDDHHKSQASPHKQNIILVADRILNGGKIKKVEIVFVLPLK